MALTISSLTELDIDKVQQHHELLRAMLQEDNPNVDFLRGVLDELLSYYGAVLASVNQEHLDRQKQSQSLKAIEENPALADDELVDAVLSNFLIERKAGTQAQGSVTIVVDRLSSVTIANGSIFSAAGKEFTADRAYVARTSSANVQSDSDRVLTPLANGTYAFTIEVTASEVGLSSRLAKDTTMVPTLAPVNFVKSYSTNDFTGGTDTETNAELMARLLEGPAVKALSGRTTMQATLRARDGFEDILATSIIGFGDAEMLRDRHTIWQTSMGGRVDWYVRTQDKPQLKTLDKTATLITKTVDGKGIWQFSLDRDDAPGYYEVVSILLDGAESTGGFEIVTELRSLDTSGDSWVPDLQTPEEASFSRYQTGTIRFKDTTTSTADLAENSSAQVYRVTVSVMPLLAEIQEEMTNRSTRNAAADLLIKAPVPCFLTLSCTIDLEPGGSEPDVDAIADALAARVNQYGFTGRLPASVLTDVAQSQLTGKASLSAMDMLGRVRFPDLTTRFIRSSELLEVPDEPQRMVSARTVAFLLDPADVSISTRVANIPEI